MSDISENMQARRKWSIQNIEEKSHQLKNFVPCEIILQKKWTRNTFSNKNWGEFFASRSALQEMLKEVLQRKGKWYRPETGPT